MPQAINYDPLSPEVMADPFPTYARMREECPVAYFTGLPTPYYVVFRYDDVHEASIDESKYTASLGASPMFREAGSLTNDGAEHMAYRQVVQARFLPRRLNQYRNELTKIVDELIDDMLRGGNNSADLVDDFAIPLPVKAASLLLGISDTPYLEVEQHAYRLLNSAWESESPELYESYVQDARNFFDHYIDSRYELLAKAKVDEAGPEHVGTVLPDDAISDLVCGKVFGRRLTREEMQQMLQVLLVGGNETTTYLITNCIWRLLEDQQRWQQVKADPEEFIPKAIEESLRYDPPGLGLWRTTKCPIEKHGTTIPANAKVQMSYASANRDPAIFERPDEFRLDRDLLEMRRHMTFGAGAHVCIGQHLSRMEMSITLKAFVERLPNLRLNGEMERVNNFGFWGRKKMPIAW